MSKQSGIIEVSEAQAGQRLDNFLLALNRSQPKSLVYKIIRKGEVRVNKKRAKPLQRLELGDLVRIPPSLNIARMQSEEEKLETYAAMGEEKARSLVQDMIIYEDDEILVLNKPVGLAVHGGSGVSHGLIELVRAAYPKAKRLELAHRLDRDTSGVITISKKLSSLRKLQAALQSDSANKRYCCCVLGRIKGGSVTSEAPLLKQTRANGERYVVVSREGKQAKTQFTTLMRSEQYTVLQARLFTGRTHQIRVHCAHLGAPIVGDKKYGNQTKEKELKSLNAKKMYLHSFSLFIEYDGQPMQFFAPFPKHWQQFLDIERSDDGVVVSERS